MSHYQWVTARHVDQVPGGTDLEPVWYTPTSGSKTAVSCPAPGGHGDVLVRTEIHGWIGVQIQDFSVGTRSFLPPSLETQLLGEVSTSGVGPDPSAVGSHEFALTASMDWTTTPINLAGITPLLIGYMRASTGGWITSKSRRGPDKYGAGSPAFNLGIHTENSDQYDPTVSGLATWYGFTVRALWLTV